MLLIAGLIVLYLPQSLIALLAFSHKETALLFFALLIIAMLSFFISYKVGILSFKKIIRLTSLKIKVAPVYWSGCLFFIACAAWLMLTADIPLLASFKGATLIELAQMRDNFTKTREGFDKVIVYIYTIMMRSFVPLSIVWAESENKKYKTYWVLTVLMILAVSLEKFLAAIVILPLIAFHLQNRHFKKVFFWFAVLLLFVTAMTFLSGINKVAEYVYQPRPLKLVSLNYQGTDNNQLLHRVGQKAWRTYDADQAVINKVDFEEQSSEGSRMVFSDINPWTFMINRICWIPFITAYDWLRYWEDELHSTIIFGKSITIWAYLWGEDKINLEREVFRYQWGGGVESTGNANAVYFVDAFINFGIIGVVIYSIVIGIIFSIIRLSPNSSVRYCSIIYAYSLCVSAFTPVLFSGGLGLILFLSFITERKVI